MAEYSKQYVENNQPGWDWDFDIEEEFGVLNNGEFMYLICEGYGFVGIQKNLDGSRYLLYEDFENGGTRQVPYTLS